MDETRDTRYVPNPDVVVREEDPDGALLFNPDTNQIKVLNTTGLFIWKLLDGKKDIPAVVAALKEAFEEVPEDEVETHVQAFFDDMVSSGFFVPA